MTREDTRAIMCAGNTADALQILLRRFISCFLGAQVRLYIGPHKNASTTATNNQRCDFVQTER